MRLLKRAKKLLETIVVAATMSLASTANAQVDPPHKNVEWAESNKAEARLLVLAANVAFGCLKSEACSPKPWFRTIAEQWRRPWGKGGRADQPGQGGLSQTKPPEGFPQSGTHQASVQSASDVQSPG